MKQYTLLTNSGINKLLKTASDGSKIALKEIVVSDYDGELSEQTASIPNEKYRGAINAITIDENDNNILDVDAIIPPEVGGFYIKTAGIFCDDGSLFAVARLADTYKPLLSEGSSKDITLSFRLQIANANDSIVLKVDNNVVLATRKWSENQFLKKTDKIDAYTKRESDEKFALKNELTDGLPMGAYLSYPTQKVIPAGFLIADGRTLKKSEYSELFDVIGYTYGGSGDNFNIPKFDDGRFFRSVGGTAAPLGQLQLGSKIVQAGHYIGNTAEDFDETAEENITINTCASPAGPILSNKVRIRPTNSSVVIIIKAKNVNTPTAGQIDKTILATEAKSGIVKLKNSITAKQEDAAVTEKAVSNAIEANKSIGIGQTWQDVKDQRQAGVTYTNTTGRPIMVCIQATMNYGIATCSVFVDGIKVGEVWEHHTVNKVDHITFLVPNGSTYKADLTIGVHTIFIWSELR